MGNTTAGALCHPTDPKLLRQAYQVVDKKCGENGVLDHTEWPIFVKKIVDKDHCSMLGNLVTVSMNEDELQVLSDNLFHAISQVNSRGNISLKELENYLEYRNSEAALSLQAKYTLKEWPITSNEGSLEFLEWRGFRSGLSSPKVSNLPPYRKKGENKVWHVNHTLGDAFCPTFLSEGIIDTDPIILLGLCKESDIGSLAGSLAHWESKELSPFSASIEYTSKLPFPMRPRKFFVNQVCAVDPETKDVLFLGFDTPGNQDTNGAVRGHCLFSFYRIRKLSDTSCLLRRAINIDLDLIFSDDMIMGSLAENYLTDLEKLSEASNDLSDEFKSRIASREIYKYVRTALEN